MLCHQVQAATLEAKTQARRGKKSDMSWVGRWFGASEWHSSEIREVQTIWEQHFAKPLVGLTITWKSAVLRKVLGDSASFNGGRQILIMSACEQCTCCSEVHPLPSPPRVCLSPLAVATEVQTCSRMWIWTAARCEHVICTHHVQSLKSITEQQPRNVVGVGVSVA